LHPFPSLPAVSTGAVPGQRQDEEITAAAWMAASLLLEAALRLAQLATMELWAVAR